MRSAATRYPIRRIELPAASGAEYVFGPFRDGEVLESLTIAYGLSTAGTAGDFLAMTIIAKGFNDGVEAIAGGRSLILDGTDNPNSTFLSGLGNVYAEIPVGWQCDGKERYILVYLSSSSMNTTVYGTLAIKVKHVPELPFDADTDDDASNRQLEQ